MRHAGHFLTALSLLVAACGGERRPASQAGRASEPGMQGMAMRMPSMDIIAGVRTYLDSVVGAEPGELPRMVAGHRDRMEQMLTAMDQDMKAMNMTADVAWQALADSVRADLAALPALSGETLVLQMRAHAGRMRRLLERHESMMRM